MPKRPRSRQRSPAQLESAKLGSQKATEQRQQKAAEKRGLPPETLVGAVERKVRRLPSRSLLFDHWLAWPQLLKPTVVQHGGALPAGVVDELRRELAWLEDLRAQAFAGMTICVVHAMSDPHARMGWEHGGPGGLGTIPIGATERWLKQERQAVKSYASRAEKEARTTALQQGITDKQELRRIGREAREATAAEYNGCFEWLCSRQMALHFNLAEGPLVLSKGEGPWTSEERGLQVVGVPDFRVLFPPTDPRRLAIRGLDRGRPSAAIASTVTSP